MENKYEMLKEWLDDMLFKYCPYWVYRLKCAAFWIPREIKYFFQRLFNKYDDRYYWSLDYSLGKDILRHLRHFKKMNRAWYHLIRKEDIERAVSWWKKWKELDKECKEIWEQTLQDMIDWFDFLVNADYLEYVNKYWFDEWYPKYEKEYNEAKRKAHLFIE